MAEHEPNAQLDSNDELSIDELEIAGGGADSNQGCGPNTNCWTSCSSQTIEPT